MLQQLQFPFCVFSDLVECMSLPGLLVLELRPSLALLGHFYFPEPRRCHLKKVHWCWAGGRGGCSVCPPLF